MNMNESNMVTFYFFHYGRHYERFFGISGMKRLDVTHNLITTRIFQAIEDAEKPIEFYAHLIDCTSIRHILSKSGVAIREIHYHPGKSSSMRKSEMLEITSVQDWVNFLLSQHLIFD